MPNDDVFNPTTVEAGAQNPATPAAPAAPPPAFVTKAELDASLQGFAQELNKAISASTPTPAPAPAMKPDEWQNQFFQDPKASIEGTINEVTAPAIATFARATSENMLGEFQREFDSKWAPGAWAKFVEPTLKEHVAVALKNNPLQVVNREAVKSAIGTLGYNNVDKLTEMRSAHLSDTTKATEAQETARMERIKKEIPGLVGGVRLTTPGADQTLDAAGKEFMENYFLHTGKRLDEKTLVASLNSGTDYDSWKAAQPKKGS